MKISNYSPSENYWIGMAHAAVNMFGDKATPVVRKFAEHARAAGLERAAMAVEAITIHHNDGGACGSVQYRQSA